MEKKSEIRKRLGGRCEREMIRDREAKGEQLKIFVGEGRRVGGGGGKEGGVGGE